MNKILPYIAGIILLFLLLVFAVGGYMTQKKKANKLETEKSRLEKALGLIDTTAAGILGDEVLRLKSIVDEADQIILELENENISLAGKQQKVIYRTQQERNRYEKRSKNILSSTHKELIRRFSAYEPRAERWYKSKVDTISSKP